MNSEQTVNWWHGSYFPARIVVGLIAIMLLMVIGGCERNPVASGLGTIAGMAQLTDPDPGTGHAGILVYLAGTPHQARTDQQGRYRIDGIPAGTYDLIAEKSGFEGQVIEGLTIAPATHNAMSPLQPATTLLTKIEVPLAAATAPDLGSIQGRVLLEGMPDENGGVRVEVDGTAFVTVSSNDGQFRILNVDPGNYQLSFYREGYLPYKTPDEVNVTTGVTVLRDVALELVQPGDPVSPAAVAAAVAAEAVTPDQVEPPPGPNDVRTIVGVVDVRDETGQPVQNFDDVTVALNGASVAADINDMGQFRFDNLTSGTYTLIGTVTGGPVVQIPVDLVTQRSASVSVQLVKGEGISGPGGTVRGRVVLVDMENQPLPDSSGVQVLVNGTQAMATTAADGSFTLTGIPPGTYTITATKETFEPGEVTGVTVTTASAVDAGEIRLIMDVDRPRVLSTLPTDNARDVAVGFDLPITVKFSDRMDASTVREAISLSPATPFTVAMGAGAGSGGSDDTLVITLSNDSAEMPIQFGAEYDITIDETAANLAGITMEEPYTFSFRTASPGIIQTSPADGANRVYVDQLQNPVLFTFNTRLDPKSINDRNIRVRPDRGMSVSTTFTNSDVNGWTTVRVATQWQPDTAYTVTVSRRVRALNGQPLGNTPFTLRFRTAPMEIMTMPILETR